MGEITPPNKKDVLEQVANLLDPMVVGEEEQKLLQEFQPKFEKMMDIRKAIKEGQQWSNESAMIDNFLRDLTDYHMQSSNRSTEERCVALTELMFIMNLFFEHYERVQDNSK